MRRPDPVYGSVIWPRPLSATHALNLFSRLAAQPGSPPLVLEFRAESGDLRTLLGTPVTNIQRLRRLVRELVPGADLLDDHARSAVTRAVSVKPTDSALRMGPDKLGPAIATALHAALAVTRKDETLVVQLVLQPGLRPTGLDSPTPSFIDQLLARPASTTAQIRTAIREKHAQHGFSAVLRIGVRASESSRRRSLVGGVLGALRLAESPGLRLRTPNVAASAINSARVPFIWPMRLSAGEVVTVGGLPIEADIFPGLPSPHPRRLPASRSRAGDLMLAASDAPGTKGTAIGLSLDSLRTHVLMTGQTGTGKSTMTLNLLVQLMARGSPVIVIEPKNDLTTELLKRIPTHRAADVVVLDPTDPKPVGLNPLTLGARTTPEQVADGVKAIFEGMYGRTGIGPRSSDILFHATIALARARGRTLVEIPKLLGDAAFRREIVGPSIAADPHGAGSFWSWYHGISEQERAHAVAPLMNKLRAVLSREQVRNVLGQAEPRFDVSQVFTENKILLVPLNKGLLGAESAYWIGSLLVSRIWESLLAQAALPMNQRPTVVIALDEYQDYAHLSTDLGDALSQSRGLGGAWVLNSQFVDQAGPLKESVLAHTRSKVVFTPSDKDAHDFARMSHGVLDAIDFTQLGQYEAYLNLQRDGRASGWVSGLSYAPAPVTSNPAALRKASRDRYGQAPAAASRTPVEAEIVDPGGSIGLRRRRS